MLRAINPATREELPPAFYEATNSDLDDAVKKASAAFEILQREVSAEQRAPFLEAIATELDQAGAEWVTRAMLETGLPEARLTGERARTMNQLKLFASVIREGSWVEAIIDKALPDRKPLPRPDLRRLLIPVGPIAVFSASNFPMAFSVAGGDTASAIAAGNPVVVKAHPAHPGTSEITATAIINAAKKCNMPEGIFSMIHGRSHEIGLRLVQHPEIKAVGFTGSLAGGKALMKAASLRPEPIPVYAEMGSTNPIFLLPGALAKSGPGLAEALVQSVTLGTGQFCTNPGLVFGVRSEAFDAFASQAATIAEKVSPGVMLYEGLCQRWREELGKAEKIPGVRVAGRSAEPVQSGRSPATVLQTDGKTFLQNEALREEMFGPSTLLVHCGSKAQLEEIARALPGQLTATLHGTEDDLAQHATLVAILRQKAGRLLFNGFPTGVEVCHAMHHGGPYPATSDPHYTSVGSAAIKRFARPVCYQNFPQHALPQELRDENQRGIWRLINGSLSKDKA